MKKLLVLIQVLCLVSFQLISQKQPASPAGLVMSNDVNESIQYYFCQDGRLKKEVEEIQQYGTWKLVKDSLKMTFTLRDGKRGIGPMINEYSYDEMVYYVVEDKQTEKHLWSEILRYMNDESYQSFKIKQSDLNCSKMNFKPQLPGEYFNASQRELTTAELKKYDKQTLRIMRNEIFARYGYIFKAEDLKKRFSSTSWYKATRANVDKYLTDLEKKNIAKITALEK